MRQRSYPRLEEGVEPISRVAVAPFGTAGDLAQAERRAQIDANVSIGAPAAEPGVGPAEATALVARYLAEALAKQGLDVTTHEDLGRVLAEVGADTEAPREIARLANERFGAEAVVLGSVARYRERDGGALGTLAPRASASRWRSTARPRASKLWSRRLRPDAAAGPRRTCCVASRYPGGGSRWLTAEELARWGAEETARSMPLGSTAGPGPRPEPWRASS